MTEQFFTTWDGTRLFYRVWQPAAPAAQPHQQKALLLFHRGHEHSGRFEEVARRLGSPDFAVFAYDARGHGRSPGDRGWAESFASLVRDADCFLRHIGSKYGILPENTAVVAHSIGAVLAATWLHDYAPPIRALVLASPAFRVKLYVPFALAFLRLRLKVQAKAFVKSYVRPGMLTHDAAECAGYASDPLISRSVAVNLLVEMHDASTRLLADAAAIRTPTLILSSGKDYVVELPAQRRFFQALSSPVKYGQEFPGLFHDLLHERDRELPLAQAAEFLRRAFEQPPADDGAPRNQQQYELLSRPARRFTPAGLNWGAQRLFLKTLGKLSRGIRTGWHCGFDSGESLDYVYRNQPQGSALLGRLIDRVYLNAPGWRGVRQRKLHLETLLLQAIGQLRAQGRPVHIFDPAAGGGSYVLETVSRLGGAPISITLRDWSPSNVEAASRLARQLGLADVTVTRGDAFDRASLASVEPRPGIAIVSGLYELFPDNDRVRESLLGLSGALADGGYLIYTNQPWHPQLEMIARVLRNREGKPWVMRCRAQAEMDALVRAGGFRKLETLVAGDGIFTVSLAQR
ncbi:MAG TPA: bifunctional alpha/beta hydrolase/class I SAM-dependent methyltransferase [Bryobacteraceae bacterium]